MKTPIRNLLTIALLSLLTPARAVDLFAEYNPGAPPFSAALGIGNPSFLRGQSFTALASGSLTHIEVFVARDATSSATDALLVELRAGTDPAGAVLASASIPHTAVPTGDNSGTGSNAAFVGVDIAPVAIASGSVYSIWVRTAQSSSLYGWWGMLGSPYSGGVTLTNSATLPDRDMGFRAGIAPIPGPVVAPSTTTGVTETGATLNATVNPNGKATTAQFQWGPSAAYGNSVPLTLTPNNGTASQLVSTTLSGLAAGILYHWRISATNADGTANSPDQTFSTPPQPPILAPVDSILFTSTRVNFSANRNGEPANCFVEYRLANGPLQQSPGQLLPPLAVATHFHETLSNLVPFSTYLYRVVILHATGPIYSAYGSFSTTASTPPAPVTNWIRRYNGTGNREDYPRALVLDGSGNAIVTGSSYGTGTEDYFTAKYAADDGAVLWERRYDGTGNGPDSAVAIALDASGNVIVTGNSHGSGNSDYYTAKYAAATGAVLWERRYNGTGNRYDYAFALAVDSSGNVVVTGLSEGVANADCYTAKYAAADGTMLWERRYNGAADSYDAARAIGVDGGGNVMIFGVSAGAAGLDYYTAKYGASDGVLLWERRTSPTSGFGDLSAASLAIDSNGDVVVTGASTNFGQNGEDYIAKISGANGAVLWERRDSWTGSGGGFPGSRFLALAVDGNRNVLVAASGEFDQPTYLAKFAAGTGAILWKKADVLEAELGIFSPAALALSNSGDIALAGNGEFDFYTVKVSGADGALQWGQRFTSPVAGKYSRVLPGGRPIAIQPDGRVVVTGVSKDDYVTVKYGIGPATAALPATAVTRTSATLNATVNPSGKPTTAQFEWGTTPNFGSVAPVTLSPDNGHEPLQVSTVLTGLTEYTVYYWRIKASNSDGLGMAEGILTTASPPPVVALKPLIHLTATSAQLNFTINPNGAAATWYVQYGQTTTYGSETTVQNLAAYTVPYDLQQHVPSLNPGTLYHYRVVAENNGGVTMSADATFTTLSAQPPEIAVEQPAGNPLQDGTAIIDFGGLQTGIPVLRTFTIRNLGPGTLTGIAVGITGTDAGDFFNTTVPAASLLPGDTTTFAVRFTPTALGVRNAALQIASNDPDENPFDIQLTGHGLTATQNWNQTWFGTTGNSGAAAPTADPNNNGINNLVEYALGGDPIGATTGQSVLPDAAIDPITRCMEFSLTRYVDRNDITLTVQAADSPGGPWLDLARSVNGTAFSALVPGVTLQETGTGSTRAVTVCDIYSTGDPAHPARMMRLKVEQ